jgi:hypothetical protein
MSVSRSSSDEWTDPKGAGGDGEFHLAHRWRRTAARASTKVGSALEYQAVCRVGRCSGCKVYAIRITRLNKPSRQGVVRVMAGVLQCRWVQSGIDPKKWSPESVGFTRLYGDPNYSGEPITCAEATGLRERSRRGRRKLRTDQSDITTGQTVRIEGEVLEPLFYYT